MSHKPSWIPREVWDKCRRKAPMGLGEAQNHLKRLLANPRVRHKELLEVYSCNLGLGPHYHVGHRPALGEPSKGGKGETGDQARRDGAGLEKQI